MLFVIRFIYRSRLSTPTCTTVPTGKPTKELTKYKIQLKNIFKLQMKMIQDLISKDMRSKIPPTELLI